MSNVLEHHMTHCAWSKTKQQQVYVLDKKVTYQNVYIPTRI